jgi:peptidoglycan hydrolase-like protein with peptidoglycan-binding domain
VLLRGRVPAYRALAEGDSGADVRQLNAALVALGYASADDVDPTSDDFGWRTRVALEKLQKALGVDQTGTLELGAAIFLPGAIRVTRVDGTLGGAAGPGGPVLEATSTTRLVTVALDAAKQAQIRAGERVAITLPDGRTTPGVVSRVGTVATTSGQGADASTTVDVEIALARPAASGRLDQAPVQVAITTAAVRDALVVPVTALLALAGGGYGVEVAGATGARRIVPVELGLADDADGLVQVTGDLRAGQRVVVPAA